MTATDRITRRERQAFVFSLVFLACVLLFSGGRSWLLRVTAPAPHPQAVLRLALPGVDIGADAWPARPGVAGYVELWIWQHDGDDIETVLRVEGSPAQLRAPHRRPRPHRIQPQTLAMQETISNRGQHRPTRFRV